MTETKRKIIATAALPYSNGEIHLGHLIEYLQTDFWVRFQKMRGHECLYICADDTHGTPIMIAARQKGITPEELIEAAHKSHQQDFAAFDIQFDNYGSTNSAESKKFSEHIFTEMEKGGYIAARTIEQTFCPNDKMFLPDRFVRGTCPKCSATDQYGDSCDSCGATYAPTDLKDAKCSVCGTHPTKKDSEHLFFELDQYRDFLREWVPKHTQKEIAKKLNEWLDDELRSWDISRDAPYFGFEIPGHPGKYFYVWLDAPIGYISSTQQWCERNGRNLDDFWRDDDAELYHFIGKDIVYFHTLFWPAMLKASGFKTPDQVFVHGFLRVNGEKMSKSKGTFLNAATFAKHVDPAYLRYYYACKMSASVDDIDLNFEDFVGRVNSDLIGKITNVASRGFQMLQKKLDGRLGKLPEDGRSLVEEARDAGRIIAKQYEERNFSKALVNIRSIADSANKYFDEYEPWKLIKSEPEKTREILTTILNQFRIMAVYLKPILPSYVQKVEQLFGGEPFNWQSADEVVEERELEKFSHLIQRVDPKNVEKVVQDTLAASEKSASKTATSSKSNQSAEINIDDFTKVDMRVARVVKAESVPGADKLLKVTLDIGEAEKTVFAGIKSCYAPEELTDRLVIVVANLKPRKMKFGTSEGMILAVGDSKKISVLSVDEGAKPGQRVT